MSPPSTATPSGPSTSYRNTASPISTSRSTASSSSEDIGDGEPIGDAASIAPAGTPAPSAFDGQLGIQEAQGGAPHDWSRSFHGLSYEPFRKEAAQVLQAPIDPLDIEVKPDGLLYLPEIKYRRILNRAFGPGGWGLAPRSETHVSSKVVSREYALVCLGRLVSVARGEQDYFDQTGIPTATEGCKSNALLRCCKDLGIASELWDPRFIREFKTKYCAEVWGEHVMTKKKKKVWRRKDDRLVYPYEEK